MKTSHRTNWISRCALTILLVCSTGLLRAATSVSQYGITWTFSSDKTVGQYANGDYYVVGPVTIISISPASTLISGRTMNGSMLNPNADAWASNGFDSTLPSYNASLNVARPGGKDLNAGNPLVIAAGSSLISSITVPTAGARPQLSDAAVLTVVSAAPAAGSFRPPYTGTNKTHNWKKSDLNYSILKSLAPVKGSPTSLTATAAAFQRPWIEICTSNGGREWHPENNQPIYGRDMATLLGGSVLNLHLNFSNAQKEPAYVNIVQYGIDVYGAAKSGGDWHANGGHCSGRKLALVLAGLALNDSAILWYANAANFKLPKGFQEDQQTFTVSAADVFKDVKDQYVENGRLRLTYTTAMIGLPEWGIMHTDSWDSSDASNWSAIYRDVNNDNYAMQALAAHLLTGGVAAWNNPEYFAYADRVIHVDGVNAYASGAMWSAYRSLGTTPVWKPAPPVPAPAMIPVDGKKISINFTARTSIGAGGYGGLILSASGGVVTVVGAPMNGLNPDYPNLCEKTWTLSRTIAAGEIVTVSYKQPGNGIEDMNGGLDVASFTALPTVNYSGGLSSGTGGGTGGGGGTAAVAPSNARTGIVVSP